MDLVALSKQLSELGMVGLSLAVAVSLAYVLWHREKEGSSKLRASIDDLTTTIAEANALNNQAREFLESAVLTLCQEQKVRLEQMNSQVQDVSRDLADLRRALVTVGVRTITVPADSK